MSAFFNFLLRHFTDNPLPHPLLSLKLHIIIAIIQLY